MNPEGVTEWVRLSFCHPFGVLFVLAVFTGVDIPACYLSVLRTFEPPQPSHILERESAVVHLPAAVLGNDGLSFLA